MRTWPLVLGLLVPAGTPLQSQALRYTPSYDNPTGHELVAVLVSSRDCVGNLTPGFRESIDSMNTFLAARARAAGIPFVAVGIATDWEPDSGFAYLKSLSHFDEFVVGRNWFNVGIAHYIWADATRQPEVPQVLLFERSTAPAGTTVTIGQERLITTFRGAAQIIQWVRDGAPLP